MSPVLFIIFGTIFVLAGAAGLLFASTKQEKAAKICTAIAVLAILVAFAFFPQRANAQDEPPVFGLPENCQVTEVFAFQDRVTYTVVCTLPPEPEAANCLETPDTTAIVTTSMQLEDGGFAEVQKEAPLCVLASDRTRTELLVTLGGAKAGWLDVSATAWGYASVPFDVPFIFGSDFFPVMKESLIIASPAIYREIPGERGTPRGTLEFRTEVFPIARTRLNNLFDWYLVITKRGEFGWISESNLAEPQGWNLTDIPEVEPEVALDIH